MEQISSNQAGFQQLIDQQHKFLNEMIESLQMKSIHSSNSMNSPPENIVDHEAVEVKVVQKFAEEHIKQAVQDNLLEGENTVVNEPINENILSNIPLKQATYSLDVNLLDSESSRQLECVESQKIYYPFPRQEVQLPTIYEESCKNKTNQIIKENPQILVEKDNICGNKPSQTLNQNVEKKERQRFYISCQRANIKSAQKSKKVEKKIQATKIKFEKAKQFEKIKQNVEFEQYFQKCKFQFCGKTCRGGNPIQMVCVQKDCNAQAQHCLNNQCNLCNNNHKSCYLKFTYDMFIKSLQRNVSRQKRTMQIVYQAYSNILAEIKKNREKTMKFLCVQGVTQTLMKDLEQRYETCHYISFKGKQILKTIQSLNNQFENNLQREIRVQQKMRQDQKDIMNKLQQQMHLLFQPYSVCSMNILNSNLLSAKNDVKFVLQQLSYPRDMKLLYRASQNEFSIKKFHQICDNQENTFTIIKTEFGKFIGGFTPLKWNTRHGRDRTNKTFLLAINLKEKLEHINHGESAIYYDERLGPSFGGLFETKDIQIFEQNGLLCCKTNFPNTFNWKKFFTSSQQSWKFLTGVQAGRKCRVIDYQVFKVYFRSEKKQ